MLAAATEGNDAGDPGIGTTTVRIDPSDRHPGDLGITTITVGIDLTVRRNPNDLGTGLTSAKTGPSDCQATEDPGTSWITMRADLIDHLDPGDPETRMSEVVHLDPGDPETRMSAVVIEQGCQGDQVHHPPTHLLHPLLWHGRQDWDRGWRLFRAADGRTR